MSKAKKRALREKEKKDLSILPYPNPIFVVELASHILITGFPPYYSSLGIAGHKSEQIKECVFPLYMFDKNYREAFTAAERISIEHNKPVANAVDFYIDDPGIYDPVILVERSRRLTKLALSERLKISESHRKLDEQKKQHPGT